MEKHTTNERHHDVMTTPGGVPVKMWTRGVQVEEKAKSQLLNISKLPFVHHHVAVMPDVHFGMGATVGSVIPALGAIVPAAVGVDIGCGMMAVRTSLTAEDLPDSLAHIRSAIERAVPHGRTNDGKPGDRGAWHDIPSDVKDAFRLDSMPRPLDERIEAIAQKHPKIRQAAERAPSHLGTLGTGNHFIEVCLDEEKRVWVMLHSGSRGIGNRIGSYFIERAKEHMKLWFINVPDQDLAYLPEHTQDFKDYVEAVQWAQEFAAANRVVMMRRVLNVLRSLIRTPFNEHVEAINCHHNYVSHERHFGEQVWLTRKGAVCAAEGVMGIIPGSMGAKSFIVRGKGNHESFNTCSHGAGRKMSRTEANRTFTLEDHAKATEGVECRKDKDVLDETPGAYKDIDDVMAAQSDLVDIVHTLKQCLCVKG
jgi:tRNA-splicing ligase RtcB